MVAVDSPGRLTAHVSSAATVRWVDGRRVHVEKTDQPTELIRQRSMTAAELTELTVTRPTLEDAYLQLIGHRLMAIEPATAPRGPGIARASTAARCRRRCASGCRAWCPS